MITDTLPAHASRLASSLRPVRLGDWCAYVDRHDDGSAPRVVRVHGECGKGRVLLTDGDTGEPARDLGAGGELFAHLLARIPATYAEDEQAREAWAAGLADGRRGQPYRRDPRQHTSRSVWALSRLAYRAGFRAGDPAGRPVAVAHRCALRSRAAGRVLALGSVPRLFDDYRVPRRMHEGLRDSLREMLADQRRRLTRRAPRPSRALFARVLQIFAEGAADFRADCPNVCGADDAHLEQLDRWRDDAADAAEAWAWYASAGPWDRCQAGRTILDTSGRYDYPRDGSTAGGRFRTPEVYADDLETGDAIPPPA